MLLVQHTDGLHVQSVGVCRAWPEHAGIVKFSGTLVYPHGITCVLLLMLFACTQRMLSITLLVVLRALKIVHCARMALTEQTILYVTAVQS